MISNWHFYIEVQDGVLVKKENHNSASVIQDNVTTPIYHYYLDYNYLPEEEHKLDKWELAIKYIFKNIVNSMIVHKEELEKLFTFDPTVDKYVKNVKNIIRLFKDK